jgi:SAM-dependent methyltransferase
LKKAVTNLPIKRCVDLGCGNGDDLLIVKNVTGAEKLIGIDFGRWNADKLQAKGIEVIDINLENDIFPFTNESVDLIIANQIMEHCKEIFWINHEIFRCLRKGGYLFLGVPNILSLHNRLLGLCGFHPTQYKSLSAHVRPFSKRDIFQFYTQIAGNFIKIKWWGGSQFYPFPKIIARPLSNIFPNSAFSIFFLIQKIEDYQDNEFLNWTTKAKLETNYYVGSKILN